MSNINADDIMGYISALGGGAVITAGLGYLVQRRKLKTENMIAESTANATIGLVTTQDLEARLAYLTKIIDAVNKHNSYLEGEVNYYIELSSKLNSRTREMATQIDQMEILLRRICVENGIDPSKYLD